MVRIGSVLCAWLAVAPLAAQPVAPPPAAAKVSRLGLYHGYSSPKYDGWQRTSRLITMRDGVRLAVDILRPTAGGRLHEEKLPVIWTHHRYHRANVVADTVVSIVGWTGWLPTVIRHGYVVAAVDTRGGGASFGVQPGFFSPAESDDAFEITEWLAAQPWSTGKVGMYGRSYLGITQYFAASRKPPSLAAIFPEMAVFDFYTFSYPGGIYRDNFYRNWQQLTYQLDHSETFTWWGRPLGNPVAPIDGDSGQALLQRAIADHGRNRNIYEMWRAVPLRDSRDPESGQQLHLERSPYSYLTKINEAAVPAYHLVGWFDAFPRDATWWFANYQGPQKLVIGPWFHGQSQGLDLAAEHLRWYDHWLKGIDNGVMREAPIHYWTLNAPAGREWRSATTWPLPNQRATPYYFAKGPSGSIGSRNDGVLTWTRPSDSTGNDRQLVDLTATTGTSNRWTSTYGGHAGYPDMRTNDAKGWTYTTAPLARPVEVTGHPVARIWITADQPDVDLYVYLEDVAPDGTSSYLTEGSLRASHRAVAPAPYQTNGVPWHPSTQRSLLSLGNDPVEMVIDLLPTSVIFPAGHRIRVTVTGADKDNNEVAASAPTVRLHRSAKYPSRIVLPVIPPRGSR